MFPTPPHSATMAMKAQLLARSEFRKKKAAGLQRPADIPQDFDNELVDLRSGSNRARRVQLGNTLRSARVAVLEPGRAAGVAVGKHPQHCHRETTSRP